MIYQVLLELFAPDDRKLRSVNYPRYNRDSYPKEADLNAKFVAAAKRGDIKAVRHLLRQKADVNAIDNDKMTALLYAVGLDNLDLVIELMSPKHRANPTMTDVTPAVSFVVEKGSIKVFQYFIPIVTAEKSSSLEMTQRIRELFARNLTMVFRSEKLPQANLHQLDLGGRSLLWLAAINGHKEAIEHICAVWSQDAIYEAFSTLDKSTKHKLASTKKHQILGDPILSICPQDIQLQTFREAVSQYFTSQDKIKVISTLLSLGFGSLEIDDEGSTALHQLFRRRLSARSDVGTFIDAHIASGKPIDLFDKMHRTPLHLASLKFDSRRPSNNIDRLCHGGASPFVKDSNGETPFSLAIETKNWIAASAFCLEPGRKTWHEDSRLLIDQGKLLSQLLVLSNDTVSWLCSLPIPGSVISSDRKFQTKPLILHVLDHGHVGFVIALLEQAPWPQDCIEAYQKGNQSDIALPPSVVQEKLKSMLDQMSEEDEQRCRARIEEGGGAQYLSDSSQ